MKRSSSARSTTPVNQNSYDLATLATAFSKIRLIPEACSWCSLGASTTRNNNYRRAIEVTPDTDPLDLYYDFQGNIISSGLMGFEVGNRLGILGIHSIRSHLHENDLVFRTRAVGAYQLRQNDRGAFNIIMQLKNPPQTQYILTRKEEATPRRRSNHTTQATGQYEFEIYNANVDVEDTKYGFYVKELPEDNNLSDCKLFSNTQVSENAECTRVNGIPIDTYAVASLNPNLFWNSKKVIINQSNWEMTSHYYQKTNHAALTMILPMAIDRDDYDREARASNVEYENNAIEEKKLNWITIQSPGGPRSDSGIMQIQIKLSRRIDPSIKRVDQSTTLGEFFIEGLIYSKNGCMKWLACLFQKPFQMEKLPLLVFL